MGDLTELLSTIVVNLVDHPEDVTIQRAEREGREIYRLRVHPEDLGKVIGKGGQTAQAIRALLGAVGVRSDRRLSLEIVD